MSKSLVDVSQFPDAIVVPEDHDEGNAASIERPLQQVTNRTRYLKDAIEAVASPNEGVRSLRTVSNLEALLTVTAESRSDGHIVHLPSSGIYVWRAASTSEHRVPWVVRPNDVATTAAGRWHLSSEGLAGSPGGLATLGADGKLVPGQACHGLIAIYQASSGEKVDSPRHGHGPATSRLIPTNAPWASFAGIILDGRKCGISKAGDRLTVHAHFNAQLVGPGRAKLALNISDYPGGILPGCVAEVNSAMPWQTISWSSSWVVKFEKFIDISLLGQFEAPGPTLNILAPWSIMVRHERP